MIWVVVAGIVLWGVWAFGSELVLNLRLNQQVQQLRDDNAQLAASNAETRKQLAVSGSPGSLEEAARKAGFARPGEQVYVIVKPSDAASAVAAGQPAVPTPAAAKRVVRQSGGRDGGVIGAIETWWRNIWH